MSSVAAFKETHLVGARTRELIVRAKQCSALGIHQISHVGIADAAVPYAMVRTNLSGTYLLACFEGRGRIFLDGRWHVCREGMACLAPPHVLHAFHAVPSSRWGFCWVRYEQPAEQKPVLVSSSPVVARFNSRPLHAAVRGLYEEVNGQNSPAAVLHWVELIHHYVLRFAQPWQVDDRLWHVWEEVAAHPEKPWTLQTLAEMSHCSGEHLRRLCRKQLGRTPMHHVTYLRMKHAATLLASTDDKVETVAQKIGYENPFVFSNTFKKWIGWRPSDYRSQREKTKTVRSPRRAN